MWCDNRGTKGEGMIKGKMGWDVLFELRKLVKVGLRQMKELCTEEQRWQVL